MRFIFSLQILGIINIDFGGKIIYYIYKYVNEVIIIKKIDKAVIKETLYIGAWILILSAIMQAVFLIIGKWDYTVLLGNLLSGVMGIINFFLLGLTVQRAVNSGDVKYAKNLMRMSQGLRLLMMLGVAILGATLPKVFNLWATLIPILFPRIAMVFRQLLLRKEEKEVSDGQNN